MDLHFEPTGKRPPFSRKVRSLETIQRIKEKIQKFTGIPAEKQTLIFKNQTLTDDLMIYETGIVNNSHIQLIIAEDQELMPPALPPPPPPLEEPTTVEDIAPVAAATASPEIKKISIILRHSSFLDGYSIEVEENDSIQGLKEKIYEEVHKGIHVQKITVRSNGVELHDHNTLHECGLFDKSEIEVFFKRSPKDMLLTILCGTETIKLEVNEWDYVRELRNKLEKMNRWEQLNLSEEGYYFKCNQNVMEEDLSFEWHNVQQGDTIEIIDDTPPANNNTPRIQEIQKAPKELKIMVLCGTETIPLEVNEWENVGELRNKLEKMNRQKQMNLSEEGFFFKHKKAVMEEDKSFKWHNVLQGDTIEIIDGLFDQSEIEVSFKRSPPANNNTPRIQKIQKAPKLLKIMLLCGTETILLEVNESDNVEELRMEVENMNLPEQLNLSQEGFFFRYKQVVMSEDKSFQWHNVQQGDTIEIIDIAVSP